MPIPMPTSISTYVKWLNNCSPRCKRFLSFFFFFFFSLHIGVSVPAPRAAQTTFRLAELVTARISNCSPKVCLRCRRESFIHILLLALHTLGTYLGKYLDIYTTRDVLRYYRPSPRQTPVGSLFLMAPNNRSPLSGQVLHVEHSSI
ncbi:uncharacterized protein F4812DRAFT_105911 [Daldinia caldariorum]|uniref:uncharacterized protein n=1 Tax=Daldinia caldariorum TaxID=326644 RepID=UPI002008898E|nr:uncharacterized protein F4812DRAFT_105911 [Daldinia caldariorum]KAI1465671.1 hypothetical protein F4812DRAFT_105911 [Daldinia caldariorum]